MRTCSQEKWENQEFRLAVFYSLLSDLRKCRRDKFHIGQAHRARPEAVLRLLLRFASNLLSFFFSLYSALSQAYFSTSLPFVLSDNPTCLTRMLKNRLPVPTSLNGPKTQALI